MAKVVVVFKIPVETSCEKATVQALLVKYCFGLTRKTDKTGMQQTVLVVISS